VRTKVAVFTAVLVGVCGFASLATCATPKAASKQAAPARLHLSAPKPADMDRTASLDGLLAKSGAADWSARKGARIEGYVVQVEKEEDSDIHLVLAGAPGESDSKKWVITEVPPAAQAKNPALGVKALRGLFGKKVAVTGWLFYDAHEKDPDPRGTLWEVHPVTSVEALEK